MSEIIVGDKPCEFTDVVIIIGKCSPPLELEGIMDLMTFLKTPDNKKNEFRRKHLVDQLSIKDMLTAALSEWRLRCSNDATLKTLIAHMRVCNFNSYADALEEKYYPEELANSSHESNQAALAPSSSDQSQQVETDKLLPLCACHVSTDRNIKNTIFNKQIEQKRYKCIIMSLAYVCLVGFVIALAFPAVGYLQKAFKERNGEEDNSKDLVSLQLEQKINKSSHYYAVHSHNHIVTSYCMQLCVNNSAKYEDEFMDIEKFKSLCLFIHANASTYWNRIISLIKPIQVKQITFIGCVPFDWLTKVLTKFVLVEKLKFMEVEEANLDCRITDVYVHHRKQEIIMKATLNHLVYLEFYNITTWFTIFNFVSQNVTMFRLNTLKIINVVTSNPVVETIRELLKLVRYSLEALHFSGVEWESSPFNSFNYIFPKLGELRIDLISHNINLIGKLNVTAPNLKRLTSLEGYLPFEENAVILGLKHIEFLQYGILVPAYLNEFDVAIYAASLPYLKYLELYILFDNSNNCNIVGENKVPQSVNLTLHSYYVN